jgi:[ribosomal protein S18]-alanine N-acetyltransferase
MLTDKNTLRLDTRAMEESDIATVAAIERNANTFPWTLKNFSDCLTAGHQSWVYYDDNDVIVGFTVVQKVVDELHLLNLCVKKEQQGQGIGKLILKSVVDYAGVIDAAMILLEVRQSNMRAQQLYLQSGFNEMAVRKDYYPAQQGREDAILMAKTLTLESFLTEF